MPSKQFQIFGVGEVLWDLLPSGPQLGGASANFVYHAHALRSSAWLISRVGDDALGHEIIARWQALGLPGEMIACDPQAPTGTVSIALGGDGQPHYTIHENVAWDRLEADTPMLAAMREADAVCFGTLAQRSAASRRAIHALLSAARSDALRILDINLRPPFIAADVIAESLGLASVLKLNDDELPVLAKLFHLGGNSRDQIVALAERFELRLVALTRGCRGSLLFADGAWSEHAGLPTKVCDTVGAGDSFTAALTLGFLRGCSLDEINARANEVAAFVCSQAGAMPPLPYPGWAQTR
jgi:fructokinase